MSFAPDWPIETERLVLRPFAESDFEAFHAIHGDERTARWLYGEPRDEQGSREHLALKMGNATLTQEDGWLSCAAVLRDTGELVGDIALHWVSETHKTGEIGYIVHPDHYGNGYAVEAARPLFDFAFGTMELHRMIGRIEARNTGSARVLEKLGLRREGHFVENEFVKGEWSSEVLFAVLAREWE